MCRVASVALVKHFALVATVCHPLRSGHDVSEQSHADTVVAKGPSLDHSSDGGRADSSSEGSFADSLMGR